MRLLPAEALEAREFRRRDSRQEAAELHSLRNVKNAVQNNNLDMHLMSIDYQRRLAAWVKAEAEPKVLKRSRKR